MSNSLPQSLGGFLAHLMEKRGVSGNALSKALGIAESSVRNLLKYGIEPGTPAPKPETLRKLGVYFGINAIFFFQLADYLAIGGVQASAHAGMIAYRFDQLPTDQQKAVDDLFEHFEQLPGQKGYGEAYLALLPQARELMERRERFVFNVDWVFDYITQSWLNDESSRVFTPNTEVLNIPPSNLEYDEETRYPYVHQIRDHLFVVFDKQRVFTIDEIQHVLDQPMARAMINLLFPHREMNVGGKLFYLVASLQLVEESMSILLPTSTALPQRDDIHTSHSISRDIWLFLESASARQSQEEAK